MRSTGQSRSIDGYKSISRNQLINLITTGKLSPTSRPAFKIEKYIAKLSKREFLYYSYGYLFSKEKDKEHRVFNKHIANSCAINMYAINKYYEQKKPTTTLEPIKKSESMKRSNINVKGDKITILNQSKLMVR